MSAPAGPSAATTRGPLARLRRWLITFVVGAAIGVLVSATAAQQVVDRLADRDEPLLS